jgi:hypothetical protein
MPKIQPVAFGVDLPACQPGKRTFQQLTEGSPNETQPDHHQHRDPNDTKQIRGQVQRGEQQRPEQRGNAETEHQTGDHPVRSPGAFAAAGVVVRGGTTGARAGMTGNTGGQHDRQYRQHTGGHTGEYSGNQAN